MRFLKTKNCRLTTVFRGVSSTVKLAVSKTALLGSNPSAPASFVVPASVHSMPGILLERDFEVGFAEAETISRRKFYGEGTSTRKR